MENAERAAQVWPVLALAARNRQTITYTMLGELVGVPRHGFAYILGHIMHWCHENRVPPLAVLVVTDKGKPGDGLITSTDFDADRERVYRHNWFEKAPTVEELSAAYRRGEEARRS